MQQSKSHQVARGAADNALAVLQEEAAYKLLKVVKQQFGKGGVPYIATHDGRTIRYPDPDIKVRPLHWEP